RASIGGQAEINRCEGRHRRRQIRVHRDCRSLAGQARERARSACGEDQGPDPGDQIKDMCTVPAWERDGVPITSRCGRDVQLTIRQRKWSYPRKIKQGETVNLKTKIMSGLVVTVAMLATAANAQEVKHYRFAHDQQLNTGYSVAYDMFSAKLKELSKGTMIVDQYPGAQLGQEPQLLQLVKAGDIEFAIVSSANTATISPQAGVMSLHFLFRDEAHVIKALADPKVFDAIKTMIDETAQGLHVIGTGSQGVRHIYSKKEVHNVGDLKGVKVRVQATPTEDTMFPAYSAQTVHMPSRT